MQLPAFVRQSHTFASLRTHRNFRLYAIGQGISLTGTWLQNAAQAWLVLQLTHAAAALGVLGFWSFGPYVVVGLFGGLVSDRFDRRLTLVATQSAYLILALALAALAWSGQITVWELDLFAGLVGLVQVVDSPARLAFVVQMVGREDLPNAVALNSAIFNVTRIIGPAVAGVLIAVVGARVCFALNALSFVAVIIALLAMRPAELFPVARRAERASPVREMVEGFRYAWRMPTVRMVLVLLLLISMLSINFSLLLPVLATQTLHADARVYGIVSAFFGVGALGGALLTAALSRANWPLLLGSAGGFGLALLLLAPQHALLVVLLTLFVTGATFTLYTSTSNALVQLATPGHLQGRVLGFYSYIFFSTGVPGALLTGWLSQDGGTLLAFIVAGAGALVMTGVGLGWYLRAGRPASISVVRE
jgi:MFS family permease